MGGIRPEIRRFSSGKTASGEPEAQKYRKTRDFLHLDG
jgi:hypothetical protein